MARKPAEKREPKPVAIKQWAVKLDNGKYLITVRGDTEIVSLFPTKEAAGRAAHRVKAAGGKPHRVVVSDA